MEKNYTQYIIDNYDKSLKFYPSISKLLTLEEIKVINEVSKKLDPTCINNNSVLNMHKFMLYKKTSTLGRILSIPKADVESIILNTKSHYSSVYNPISIGKNYELNLQSGFYIKQLESDIKLKKENNFCYITKFDRVNLLDGIYKLYETTVKVDSSIVNCIKSVLINQYKSNNQVLSNNALERIDKQSLFLALEYTTNYPNNSFDIQNWILYRLKNERLYCNDADNNFLKQGKPIIALEKELSSNHDWQPVKTLIFKNQI